MALCVSEYVHLHLTVCVYMCVCVCVLACEGASERETQRKKECMTVILSSGEIAGLCYHLNAARRFLRKDRQSESMQEHKCSSQQQH